MRHDAWMYASWCYIAVTAVLSATSALLQSLWLARCAGTMLVAASAALLLFAVYPVDALRPFAGLVTFEGMGRPFIPAGTNRYVAGAMLLAVCGFMVLLVSNTWRARE